MTHHGPGQLVLYPILNLRHHRQDLHWYMRSLEEVAIRCQQGTLPCSLNLGTHMRESRAKKGHCCLLGLSGVRVEAEYKTPCARDCCDTSALYVVPYTHVQCSGHWLPIIVEVWVPLQAQCF